MREQYLPFSPPLIGEEEIAEVVRTLRSNWITTGPKTRQFERDFTASLGARGALALNSCTASLHIALLALQIGHGDEVITTPMTFAASANVIEHVGARPVFVDVEPDTLNLDPDRVEAAVSPRTKGILAVHFAGHPVELDAIRAIAERHRLHLIEDAAHALPATYRGESIGSGPNPTAFSFYATKNLTTGEGGMLTGDADLLSCARVLSLHGMTREAWNRYERGGQWRYDVVAPGFKYNMTDIQAAIGLWQLQKLAGFQRRRRRIVELYHNAFFDIDALELPVERPEVKHAWHLYPIRLRKGVLQLNRDQFIEELRARNIGTSVHYIPVHLHSYYRRKYGYRLSDLPIAADHSQRIVSLPLSPSLKEADVADVIEAVLEITHKYTIRRSAA